MRKSLSPSLTTGKGSSGGDFAAWAAKENGNAPAAMICLESEPVLSGAVIATEIPTVDRPEKNVFDLIKTGKIILIAVRGNSSLPPQEARQTIPFQG